MASQTMVAIGASAGGVDALTTVARTLPPDLAAPVFVVLHVPATSPSLMPQIMSRSGPLPAKAAQNGERWENGIIYIAPPDLHMLVRSDGTIRTVRGPRENRHRPAIDPLFRSVALTAGSDAIGVILTGSLDDGTAGSLSIKNQGGVVLVQDPKEAVSPSMPQSVIEHVKVDSVLPLASIAAAIAARVNNHQSQRQPRDTNLTQLRIEKRIAEMEPDTLQDDERPGKPSAYSCPDCGGVLWEIEENDFLRYRCRVGHAYSPDSMLGAQTEILEEAIWTALKTLEESARLSHRLAENETQQGHEWMAARFREREQDARQRAEVLRRFLIQQDGTVPVETGGSGS